MVGTWRLVRDRTHNIQLRRRVPQPLRYPGPYYYNKQSECYYALIMGLGSVVDVALISETEDCGLDPRLNLEMKGVQQRRLESTKTIESNSCVNIV